MILKIIFQIALWAWFFGCITGYRLGKWLLVEGEGVKSAEFIMLRLYSLGLLIYYLLPTAGRWVLFAILLLWLIVQFFCHWYYTLFGASEAKLKGYNESFKGTVRLLPASNQRIVPDLYHIVLHLLIIVNLVACVV